ncbi:MAG: hypothetical protein COA86_10325 [Kangiella sp.]|nr:MAG: hypothetical protein COA86_10325 [Kangiella sp.]
MKYWIVFLIFIMDAQAEDSNLLATLLSENEVSYLKSIETLTVCNVAQAASDQASYDVVKLLLKHSGISLKRTEASSWSVSFQNLLNKNCDILPWATEVPQRLAIMNFTRPYARIKRVIVTKKSQSYIRDLSEVENEVFATLRGNTLLYQLKTKYPNIKMIDNNNASDVLSMVANGEVYGGFASLYSVANLFDEKSFYDLKIAGILPPDFDDVVSLATRKEDTLLIGILEKIIIAGDKQTLADFLSRGATTTMRPTVNYKEYWLLTLVVFLFVVALVWWNRKLTMLNKKLNNTRSKLEAKTRELELLSETDSLTQTYNRVKLDQVFNVELSRAERYGYPLSIIMIDIDYFKNVNDSHGHIVGDQVLTKFASLIQGDLRSNDILGRWGGEEFLIICPSTNLSKAEMVSEKLRQIIENSNFSPIETMTASFGVTEWVRKDTQETLISRADYAMYISKKHGRNKVSLSIAKMDVLKR